MTEEPTNITDPDNAALPTPSGIPNLYRTSTGSEITGDLEHRLSKNELIDQTYQFMESFRVPLEKGEAPDTVFFTLKSAVPVARMMKKLWCEFYPDNPLPQIRFVDVGRIKAAEIQTTFNKKKWELKTTYFDPKVGGPSVASLQEHFTDTIDINGRILIVDELSDSGKTIQEAKRLFNEAFPHATVSTQVVYDKIPYWFNESTYIGLRDASTPDREDRALHIINQVAAQRFAKEHPNEEFKPYQDEFEMMGSAEGVEDHKRYVTLIEQQTNSPYGNVTHPEHGEAVDKLDPETYSLGRQEEESICNAVLARLQTAQSSLPQGS